jgi:uncharacterized protein with von Willebrand factor type A (vWA) domain
VKTRLLTFIDALRDAGLAVTVGETLDAMRAVGAIGIEPLAFREGLAATLIKNEADRPIFDAVFDRFFATPGHRRGKGERRQPSEHGTGSGTGKASTQPRPTEPRGRPQREATRRRPAEEPHIRGARTEHEVRRGAEQLARIRALQLIPFREMSPDQVDACEALVAELAQRLPAHFSRRGRAARRGRLDIRRTLRRSLGHGGVPMHPAFRERRPGRPDLVALCDCSHSVATACNFLLALLVPAQTFFRRVRLFAFVDRPAEVSMEAGKLIPHEPLDLYARSDFGHVLDKFWVRYDRLLTRNTLLLILGDARNNRRPPRADLLARIRSVVRQVIWLNPEPPQLWNTGDSVMRTYQRHCDAVLGASNLQELRLALRRVYGAL